MTSATVQKIWKNMTEIQETKEKIKELVQIQKEEKVLLRTPHHKLPKVKIKTRSGYEYESSGIGRAGNLMCSTRYRAAEITNLHIKYNIMRGRPEHCVNN